MKVLSVSETPSIAVEADRLCALAETARASFAELGRGQRTTLDGFDVRCHDPDKNIILEISGQHRWFLKYSLQEEWVQREIAGAEALASRIGEVAWYQHPTAIRASLEHRYTLYGCVVGRTFNAAVLRACIDPRSGARRAALEQMRNLGRSFGRLHGFDGPPLPALNPTTISHVEGYLARANTTQSRVADIARLLPACRAEPGPGGWIHSNVKSEDIFFDGTRVSVIDFGTCGCGAVNEDLGSLCAYLLMLRTIPGFPWRYSRSLLTALLAGYAEAGTLETRSLNLHVALCLARYYLRNACLDAGKPSLSGLPVLKSRLERLLGDVMSGVVVAA